MVTVGECTVVVYSPNIDKENFGSIFILENLFQKTGTFTFKTSKYTDSVACSLWGGSAAHQQEEVPC